MIRQVLLYVLKMQLATKEAEVPDECGEAKIEDKK